MTPVLRALMLGVLLAGGGRVAAQQPTPACAAAAAFLGIDGERARLARDTAVADPRSTQMRRGCWLGLATTRARLPTGPRPEERVRAGLLALGWQEDLRYAADGPDGTAFALRHGRDVCFVAASWDGGDDSDPTYVPSDRYTLTVRCAAAD